MVKLAKFLRRWADRIDPPIGYPSPIALKADELVAAAQKQTEKSTYKRHWVATRLRKAFPLESYPAITDRDISLQIEYAVRRFHGDDR